MVIKGYKTYQGSECLLACFHNVIKYYGIDVDESEIFILGEGLRTKYTGITRIKSNVAISSHVNSSVLKFCSDYHIQQIFKQAINDSYSENDMIYYLSRNIPVTVKVDPGYLKYSPVYTKGYGLTHFINIVGYESKDDLVLVSDGYVPSSPPSTYHRWYSYSTIKESRRIKGNTFFAFSLDIGKVDSSTYKKIEDMTRMGIKKNLEDYLNGVIVGEEYYGIKAINKFSDDILHSMELFSNDFSEVMFRLNYVMKIYGLVTSKYLLFKAFKKLYQASGNSFADTLINDLAEMANEWNKISLLVVRTGILQSKDSLIALSNRIRKIALREEQAYNMILSMI